MYTCDDCICNAKDKVPPRLAEGGYTHCFSKSRMILPSWKEALYCGRKKTVCDECHGPLSCGKGE